MNVRILFIDDDSIDSIVEKVELALKQNGVTIIPFFINLSDPMFKMKNPENPDQEVLDFEKIKEKISQDYMNEDLDIVACDYYYSKTEVLNGAKILSWVKNVANSQKKRIRRAKFCLYSSEVEKISTTTNTVDEIRRLIAIKLTGLYHRGELSKEIISLCSKSSFNASSTFVTELNKSPHTTFKSTYPVFLGKTFGEIADEIDKDSHHGIGFTVNLIELSVNHLIKLNNED